MRHVRYDRTPTEQSMRCEVLATRVQEVSSGCSARLVLYRDCLALAITHARRQRHIAISSTRGTKNRAARRVAQEGCRGRRAVESGGRTRQGHRGHGASDTFVAIEGAIGARTRIVSPSFGYHEAPCEVHCYDRDDRGYNDRGGRAIESPNHGGHTIVTSMHEVFGGAPLHESGGQNGSGEQASEACGELHRSSLKRDSRHGEVPRW